EGGVYTYSGVDYAVAGQYVLDTLPAVTGCDTILTLNLAVDTFPVLYVDASICTGETYSIGGMDFTMSGTYLVDTLDAATGCDSIRILRLTVDDFVISTQAAGICVGEVFTYNGADYSVAGNYLLDTLPNAAGCDTLLFLDLQVSALPIVSAGADQVLDCQATSVVLDGSVVPGMPMWSGPGITGATAGQWTPVVTLPGLYTLTVTSAEGCTAVDEVEVVADPETVLADAGADAFLTCDILEVTLQGGPVGADLNYQWTGPGISA